MALPDVRPRAVSPSRKARAGRSFCPECRLTGDVRGFTLLELMLSLTLLGVVLLITFGALRVGTRAWEKGERDVSVEQRRRAVLNLMEKQIASACPYEVKVEDDAFYFKGCEAEMAFVSRIPIVPGSRSGVVFVRYKLMEGIDGDHTRLMLFEKDMGFLKAEDITSEDERDFVELVSKVNSIDFSYLKEEDNAGEIKWQSTWNPEDDKGMPAAVQVVFQQEENTVPVRRVVPIRSRKE